MATRFSESFYKAAKKAREEEMRKKIKEVTLRLTAQLNSQWA